MGVILAVSAVVLIGVSWILLTPGHPRDPAEDEEQERYLKEWGKQHGNSLGIHRKGIKRKGGKK